MQLSYLSKTPGIGGSIKTSAEDFIVEEIMSDGTVLELGKKIINKIESSDDPKKDFVHFILQKKNWSTADAISAIAKKIHTNHKRFNAAGTKDKISHSTQLVSCFGIDKERIESVLVKDMQINGAWYASDKVKLGDLYGNRFRIKINGVMENADQVVSKIYHELNGRIPNYFGEQRFGSTRRNTHIVGEQLVKGRLKDAALRFLCDTDGEENQEAVLARKELKEKMDFERALQFFPKYLRLERIVIAHLAQYENDYAGALRKLPRSILLLFIHAFQSHLFNIVLSERVSAQDIGGDGNIIGYETELTEREKDLLGQFGIRKEDFRLPRMPEIGSKGTKRALTVALGEFSFKKDTFSFSLPSGSYATVALREFLDEK